MKTLFTVTALLFLSTFASAAPQKRDVVSHYAALAHAVYDDSLIAAQNLQKAVHRLIANKQAPWTVSGPLVQFPRHLNEPVMGHGVSFRGCRAISARKPLKQKTDRYYQINFIW